MAPISVCHFLHVLIRDHDLLIFPLIHSLYCPIYEKCDLTLKSVKVFVNHSIMNL